MPSQNQTTLCQACGDFVPTAEMPDHVAKHANQARAFERSFERITGRHVDAPPAHVLRDLLCNGDAAVCDCFYHENARRAEATHDDEVTETALTVAPVEQPCSEFNGRYAERGDAIAELLDAVSCGATLEVSGPSIDDSTVRAWIESAAGMHCAQAEGSAIGPVLVELARNWKVAASALGGTVQTILDVDFEPKPPMHVWSWKRSGAPLIKRGPKVETCCYGFLHKPGEPRFRENWQAIVDRPFRGSWLWVFGDGDAQLTSLRTAITENLVGPMPFGVMDRGECNRPELFRTLVDVDGDHEQFFGTPCRRELAVGLGAPGLILPTLSTGQMLRFGFTGNVRGVVLVGEQVLP
jgi:hypothetical protein